MGGGGAVRYDVHCKYCGLTVETDDRQAGMNFVAETNSHHDSGCPRHSGSCGGDRQSRLDEDIVQGYHQTDESSARSILRGQFHRGSSGLAGGGIYFATSAGDTHGKAHKHGVILVADIKVSHSTPWGSMLWHAVSLIA